MDHPTAPDQIAEFHVGTLARVEAERDRGRLGRVRRLVLDVSSMMYRAFFAIGEGVRSPGGRQVGALYGYLDMVVRLVVSRRPEQVIHAYDHEWRPVARTDIYAGYKANRPPDPDGLPEQFTMLRQVLTFTELWQAQTPDWEAEDAIGAICAGAARRDRIEIVSGDRDLIQLVRDPAVRLLMPLRGVSELRELDEAAVLERYGVPASRYADFAILRGDPSDGLPGVRGVGEKTARALIEAYGSLDELLEDAASESPRAGPLRGKPALRARIRDDAAYLDAMRELVPVNSTAAIDLWQGERDDEALAELAHELGVKGSVQRLRAALDSQPS
jgi:5'-3' exonuclease